MIKKQVLFIFFYFFQQNQTFTVKISASNYMSDHGFIDSFKFKIMEKIA